MNPTVTLQQLTRSDNPQNRLKVMIGGKDFVFNEAKKAVSFKFSGCPSFNHVEIILNSMDTYDVKFGKIASRSTFAKTGKIWTRRKEVDGIYDDMLFPVFEDVTGLFLSL